MEKLKTKKTLVAVLSALLLALITTTVIMTATGCVVCRDCGPNRHWNGWRR